MIFVLSLLLLMNISSTLFAEEVFSEKECQEIEEVVFKSNTVEYIKSLYTNNEGVGKFQNALVSYRLGNQMTNYDYMKKSFDSFEAISKEGTNVFTISYMGVAHSGLAMLCMNPVEKLDHLKKALTILDKSVALYPDHYLPHFYRGMMNLFVPGFLGGKEDIGTNDIEFVLNKMPEINRNNEFKGFIYFIYAIYWGEMKKKYSKALDLIAFAETRITDSHFLKGISNKRAEYTRGIKK
ncbi:MAG: hypothetical protein A2355_09590 [Spirochaetes bacterium RIFOXYB1_FULL_32_8]|nr:MAG: hypothetical protein A2355_09590 [Spirochaetes bacterium RIFOXYB1_FULL_32_8]